MFLEQPRSIDVHHLATLDLSALQRGRRYREATQDLASAARGREVRVTRMASAEPPSMTVDLESSSAVNGQRGGTSALDVGHMLVSTDNSRGVTFLAFHLCSLRNSGSSARRILRCQSRLSVRNQGSPGQCVVVNAACGLAPAELPVSQWNIPDLTARSCRPWQLFQPLHQKELERRLSPQFVVHQNLSRPLQQ